MSDSKNTPARICPPLEIDASKLPDCVFTVAALLCESRRCPEQEASVVLCTLSRNLLHQLKSIVKSARVKVERRRFLNVMTRGRLACGWPAIGGTIAISQVFCVEWREAQETVITETFVPLRLVLKRVELLTAELDGELRAVSGGASKMLQRE